jgi:uncharacterized membrane protein
LTDSLAPRDDEQAQELDMNSPTEAHEDFPVRKKESSASIQRTVQMSMAYSGPIPDPRTLKAYDLIKPGLAQEIVNMAQAQSKHRMELESTVVRGDNKRAELGLIFGFLISCLALGGGIYLIDRGHDAAGATLSTGSIAALVGVFVYGSNNRREERKEKIETLTRKINEQED